jgi:hypothetical protein
MDESQIAEAVRASLFFVNHSLIFDGIAQLSLPVGLKK